jgi:ABC-2 type transport system ATP-binding protein
MAEDIIQAEGLTRRFGDFTAVDAISLTVARGEIFGFLGANGAGKTTAMRMFCGLLKPSAGKARVAGYDVWTETEDIKRNIGYMSQRFSLYDDLSVVENIRFYAGIYGLGRAEVRERGDRMLEELGLTAERKVLVRSLPPGWKQRLAFSVAIIHEPGIVFLDEPTGGVDPITRREFWKMIYRAADRGITVFVTTHYMDEAEYCDRVSIMVDGRIEALDTPAGLKRDHGTDSINEVFLRLARQARRTE